MIGLAACAGMATAATAVITPHATATHLLADMWAPLLKLGNLGRGQRPAVDPEVVNGRSEIRIARVLRAADPVLGGGTERGRPYRQSAVAGHLGAVDVENTEVAGVRDRHVRP